MALVTIPRGDFIPWLQPRHGQVQSPHVLNSATDCSKSVEDCQIERKAFQSERNATFAIAPCGEGDNSSLRRSVRLCQAHLRPKSQFN